MQTNKNLTLEELQKENERLKRIVEKGGLIWKDYPEKNETKDYVITLNKELSLLTEESTDNKIIEGDNLLALRELQKTHRNKIDVIYIDPPYNTGNDFVYDDKRVSSDGYSHSKWLSFMDKRLRLAKNLMTDDGVIFVSIDDNEVAQLKLLMDSVFGERNFIAMFSWERSRQGSNLGHHVKKTVEYVHCYAKEKVKAPFLYGKKSDPNSDIRLSKRTNAKGVLRFPKGTEVRLEDGIYTESKPESKKQVPIKLIKPIVVKNQKSVNEIIIEGNFIWSQKFLDDELEKGSIAYFKTEGFTPNVLRYNQSEKVLALPTLLSIDSGAGTTQNGTELVSGILGNDFLNIKMYPKPIALMKKLLLATTKENKSATVLDFFAGSGTTGHAVMKLNKEDGGNRSFILCTNNEVSEEKVRKHFMEQGLLDKNTKTAFKKFYKENESLVQEFLDSEAYQELGIARSITRERIKRVSEGYTTPKGVEVEGLGGGFEYYIVE